MSVQCNTMLKSHYTSTTVTSVVYTREGTRKNVLVGHNCM